MRQHSEVFSGLEQELIADILSVCSLTEKQEYTAESATRIAYCLELIAQGKTLKQVAAHFKRQDKQRSHKEEYPEMTILEMLAFISAEYGIQVELTEAIEIMAVCGLSPNQKHYKQLEGDRFLEACLLIKEQSKSYQEVAEHFGISLSGTPPQQISSQISQYSAVAETGIVNLVDAVTEKRAENIPGLVNQMYLKNVVKKLAESQEDIKSFYTGLEEQILEQIEGKSPVRLIMEGRWSDWEKMKYSPPSSEKPMLPPIESENTTSNE